MKRARDVLRRTIRFVMPEIKVDNEDYIMDSLNFAEMLSKVTLFNSRLMGDNLHNIGDDVLYCNKKEVCVRKKDNYFQINGALSGTVTEIHKTAEVLGMFDWYYTVKTDDGEAYELLEKNLLPLSK